MSDILNCPQCGRPLRVPERLRGHPVRCPGCQETFTPPLADEPDADPPDASPAVAPPIAERISTAPIGRPSRAADRVRDDDRLRDEAEDDEDDEDDEEAWERAQERRRLRDRPDRLPGGGRALAAMLMLGLSAVVDLASCLIQAWTLDAGPLVLAEDKDLAEALSNPAACVQPFVYLGTVIAFCLWIYRAYKNLDYFPVRGLQYSAGWAVGSFFIPIMNLFRPVQIAQEMWRASDPTTPRGERQEYAWRENRGSLVIGFWWAFWIVSNIANNIAFRLQFQDRADATVQTVASMVGDALAIPAALFAILMIAGLRRRQQQRF